MASIFEELVGASSESISETSSESVTVTSSASSSNKDRAGKDSLHSSQSDNSNHTAQFSLEDLKDISIA